MGMVRDYGYTGSGNDGYTPPWYQDPNNPWAFPKNPPPAPGYMAGFDPATMSLTPEMMARIGGLRMDTRGLEAFRNLALRGGPSAAARIMERKSFAEEADARERAKREARGTAAEARTELAMRGGLSSGARERIATGGARNLLAMSQDTGRQGNLNRMQIGINDEQQRISQLSMLPGMEQGLFNSLLQKENLWARARESDIARAMQENQNRNSYNQNLYAQQMQAWAAQRQAEATENAGKK